MLAMLCSWAPWVQNDTHTGPEFNKVSHLLSCAKGSRKYRIQPTFSLYPFLPCLWPFRCLVLLGICGPKSVSSINSSVVIKKLPISYQHHNTRQQHCSRHSLDNKCAYIRLPDLVSLHTSLRSSTMLPPPFQSIAAAASASSFGVSISLALADVEFTCFCCSFCCSSLSQAVSLPAPDTIHQYSFFSVLLCKFNVCARMSHACRMAYVPAVALFVEASGNVSKKNASIASLLSSGGGWQ